MLFVLKMNKKQTETFTISIFGCTNKEWHVLSKKFIGNRNRFIQIVWTLTKIPWKWLQQGWLWVIYKFAYDRKFQILCKCHYRGLHKFVNTQKKIPLYFRQAPNSWHVTIASRSTTGVGFATWPILTSRPPCRNNRIINYSAPSWLYWMSRREQSEVDLCRKISANLGSFRFKFSSEHVTDPGQPELRDFSLRIIPEIEQP